MEVDSDGNVMAVEDGEPGFSEGLLFRGDGNLRRHRSTWITGKSKFTLWCNGLGARLTSLVQRTLQADYWASFSPKRPMGLRSDGALNGD